MLVVYATRLELELEVADTSTAAHLVSDIAYNYGDYLARTFEKTFGVFTSISPLIWGVLFVIVLTICP